MDTIATRQCREAGGAELNGPRCTFATSRTVAEGYSALPSRLPSDTSLDAAPTWISA